MNRLVVSQCDFCFCDLKPRFHNSSICEKCIVTPLPSGAITSLARYPHCVNCDKLLCPFHLSTQYLSQELCKTCYGITIRRAITYNYDFDSSDDNSFPLPWPASRGGLREQNDDDEETTMDYENNDDEDEENDEDDEDNEEWDGDGDEYQFERASVNNEDEEKDDNGEVNDDGEDVQGGGDTNYNSSRKRPRIRGMDRFYRVVELDADNVNTCPICLEFLRTPSIFLPSPVQTTLGTTLGTNVRVVSVALNCHGSHIFHLECAARWLKKNAVCPLCCKKLDV